MDIQVLCPSAEKCPIFSGVLIGRDYTTKTYQDKYCKAGADGRLNCRRWQVKQMFGQCPPNILPNSLKSVEEIGKENNYTKVQ